MSKRKMPSSSNHNSNNNNVSPAETLELLDTVVSNDQSSQKIQNNNQVVSTNVSIDQQTQLDQIQKEFANCDAKILQLEMTKACLQIRALHVRQQIVPKESEKQMKQFVQKLFDKYDKSKHSAILARYSQNPAWTRQNYKL